ncbi:hypothetical protein [Streptomyces sp. 891-h]|uniref:hypothetical protein n=1 Tax=unclassified Streptomyces TaxID=2593676 RepID=UPI001FAA54BF|nr:hypothetical protein [Streptomyces sp. 891-h]UNZ20926.1 hypothetical protein HC362_31440 [Streptomyces sp. 891-h]
MPDKDEESGHGRTPGQLRVYGEGVRTALQDNATAYGFSLSITAAYGLAGAVKGPASAVETVVFAFGAAGAFLVVNLSFLGRFARGRLSESQQMLGLKGSVDFLSVAVAVAVAFGLAHLPDPCAWPVTGLGTVASYLLIGGLDVVVAQFLARHTSVGRSQEEADEEG